MKYILRQLVFCLACLCMVQAAQAQKKWYLLPLAGGAVPLAVASPANSILKNRTVHFFGPVAGLGLKCQLNERYAVVANYILGDQVWLEPQLKQARQYQSIALSSIDSIEHTYMRRISLGVEREMATVLLFPMYLSEDYYAQNPDSKLPALRHLLAFKLKTIAGLSYNLNINNNFALFAGFNFQFLNSNRDFLQLSLLYYQGLGVIAANNYTVTTDKGGSTTTTMRSRGSAFQLQLTYPIRLKFKKSR